MASLAPALAAGPPLATTIPGRPGNRQQIAMSGTAAPPVANNDPGSGVSRTPRKESNKSLARFKLLQGSPKQQAVSAPPVGGNQSTGSSSENPAVTQNGVSAGDSSVAAETLAVRPASTARSRRWGIIRKGFVPNPALMKVNEKVLQIIQTLRKPPEDRTENDIKLLYTWLMNQEKLSSLFTTMSEISAKKLCKEMEFLHLESGDVVVNQGDKGNTCFILVSGIVSVYVRGADDQKKFQRVMRASAHSSNARALMEQGLLTYGAKVATLTPGATFGELCLIEPDSKRSATVVVDPMAQIANFIVLTAASYLRLTRSQTIEGTITDHIAFLQHMLLFSKWTKMQLMHLVNSMKLLAVPAGQYITHKGSEAECFYLLLRGDAQESVKLMLNDQNEISENHSVQHCVTVELTYLGKFDVAGEYLAAEKKVVTCPVDIRAVTDVDCLVLSRKLFNMHFGGKEMKKHALNALKRLRTIAEQRETWRETRIDQALQYPNLRVPITRKLMRLSGNSCMICGRDTHIAGDELCMELATYNMTEEKKKKQLAKGVRAMSKHRISIVVPSQAMVQVQAAVEKAKTKVKRLPALNEEADDDDEEAEDDDEDDDDNGDESRSQNGDADEGSRRCHRLGHRLVKRQWKAAERAGLKRPPAVPQRPQTTPLLGRGTADGAGSRTSRFMSITRTEHVSSKRKLQLQQQERNATAVQALSPLDTEVRRIRASWPYGWRDLEPVETPDALPHFERLYRNSPRPKSPETSNQAMVSKRKPHTAR